MRTNVRIGNDIKLIWQILKGGQPVDLTGATDVKVSVFQGGNSSCGNVYIDTFKITDAVNGILSVEIPKEVITEVGYMWTVLEYTLHDDDMIDGDRKVTVDNVPVRIVSLTAEASQVYEFNVSSDILAGFQGLSAYEVWLKDNPGKTKEDYFNWLQKPATDIAETVGLQEQARVEAENTRKNNEEQRVTAETNRQNNFNSFIEVSESAVNTFIGTAQGDINEAISNAETATTNANNAASNADNARLAIQDDLALKADQADLVQFESDVSLFKEESNLKDAIQDSKIKDIENVLSTANLNQSAQLSVSGTSPLSLPKNAANGGMSVKLEGLTEDVGGVITNFEPTGRVRSVDKNGLNPTALYLAAPELRSNGTVKDEIRKGVNGYELVKRVGVGTLGNNLVTNGTFDTATGWTVKGESTISNGSARIYTPDGSQTSIGNPSLTLSSTKAYKAIFDVLDSNGERLHLSNIGAIITPTPIGTGISKLFVGNDGYLCFRRLRVELTDVTIDNVKLHEVLLQDGAISDTSVFTELSDGTILYTLATPEIIPISYGGVLNSAENGTVYHEPIIADAGVYDTKMDILLTDYPIATIEEIIKHENGVDTYLNVATAVVASDGLSFTHPDLADGDLVLFTYAFDKESTNGNITATFYDSNVVKIDTVTGKAYKIEDVVTNGVLTRTLTEV